MTTVINALPWIHTASNSKSRISKINCDFAIDPQYIVYPAGTDDNGDAVEAANVVCDNLANNSDVKVNYGPFDLTVSKLTRQTLIIPKGTTNISFLLSAGLVTLTFCERDMGIPFEQVPATV